MQVQLGPCPPAAEGAPWAVENHPGMLRRAAVGAQGGGWVSVEGTCPLQQAPALSGGNKSNCTTPPKSSTSKWRPYSETFCMIFFPQIFFSAKDSPELHEFTNKTYFSTVSVWKNDISRQSLGKGNLLQFHVDPPNGHCFLIRFWRIFN